MFASPVVSESNLSSSSQRSRESKNPKGDFSYLFRANALIYPEDNSE